MTQSKRNPQRELLTQARSSKRHWRIGLLWGGTTLLAAGLLVFIISSWQIEEGSQQTASAGSPDQEPVSRLQWQEGVEHQYAFELETAVQHGTSHAELMQLKLRGPLAVSCLEPGFLRAQFTSDLLDLSGSPLENGADSPDQKELMRQFNAPFYIQLDRHGRFERVKAASDSYEFVERLWQSLAATMQFVEAPHPKAKSWNTIETDTVGEFAARYEMLGPQEYSKQKMHYRSAAAGKQLSVAYSIDHSRSTFQFSKGGVLEALHHDERLDVRNAPVLGTMQTTTHMSLTRLQDRRVAQFLAEWLKEARLAKIEPKSESPSTILDRARTQNMAWPDILAHFRRLKALESSSEDDENLLGRARIALKATLRLEPKYVEIAEQGVLERGPLAREFLNALRDAGTSEATAALARLARNDTLPASERFRVTTALSVTKAATAESLKTLRELRAIPELREQATYGVGSAIRHLSQAGDPAAGSGINYLLNELGQSKSEYEGRALLEALGNAGQIDALPVIAKYANDPAPRLRGGVAQSLRRIESPAADELLAQLLQDMDPSVRALALDAVSERTPTIAVAKVIGQLLVHDPSAANRIRAIRLAKVWSATYPELNEAIQYAALNDSVDTVKDTALRAMRSKS